MSLSRTVHVHVGELEKFRDAPRRFAHDSRRASPGYLRRSDDRECSALLGVVLRQQATREERTPPTTPSIGCPSYPLVGSAIPVGQAQCMDCAKLNFLNIGLNADGTTKEREQIAPCAVVVSSRQRLPRVTLTGALPVRPSLS